MQAPRMLVFGTGVFLRGFLMDFASRAGFKMTLVSSTPAGDDRVDHCAFSDERFSERSAHPDVVGGGACADTGA